MPNDSPPLAQRIFMTLGSTVLIVAILYWGHKFLIPLALAILLTFILTPVVALLQRRKLPRVPAAALTVLLASALVAGLAWVVTLQLRDLADELPQHTQTITAKIHALQGDGNSILARLNRMGDDILRQIKVVHPAAPADGEKPMPVVIYDEHPYFLSFFPAVAGSVAELLASVVLVVMLVVFMLIRREDLRFRLIQLVGRGRLTLTTRALDEAMDRISAFLGMQLTINTAFGLVWFLGLLVLGVPFAFLWGFLSAVLRFIPYIGTWVALFFPLVLSVAVFPDWHTPVEVVGVYLVLEILTANVFEPLLFSHSTGASPVALLVAAAFWTWLWGPLGLVLSTPLTVCLIVLGRNVPQLAFFDILLGSEPVMEPDVRFYQRLLAQDEDEAAELVEQFTQQEPDAKVDETLLLPALIQMRRDADRGELAPEDQQFILHSVRDILDDIEPDRDGADPSRRALVVACPARDEADELALQIFRQRIEASGARVEVLSATRLSAEMVRHIEQEQPVLVCIGALASGGLAHARYLCKRLRRRLPELKIHVGRWGQKDNQERTAERLRAAGADKVAFTLSESCALAVPLVQVAAAPGPRRPATAAAH